MDITDIVTDPDVAALVEKLDGLPLALATTGAYLEHASVSIATYLDLYNSSWTQLHEEDDTGLDTYEDRTLYTTWRISLQRIQQHNELSANLLSLWCYFSNQDLWYELLSDGDAGCLPWLGTLTESLPAFIKGMRPLCNYGLAESNAPLMADNESGGYSMHSCVHAWTIHALNKQWNNEFADFAVGAVGRHVPSQEAREPWTTQRRLIPHAQRCLQYVLGMDSTQPGIADHLHNIADLLSEQNKTREVEVMYLRALQGKEETWGPKHASTLDTVNNLGLLYANLGRMQEAEKMYLRALQGKEETWGPKHTSTLGTVNNLGVLYKNLERIQKAEKMYLRALQGKEETWGPKHASTLNTVNNLGNLYADLGRMQEAEKMYLRALQGKEETWGPKHASTLDTVNNLGNLYADLGRIQEAEKMYLRALAGYKEAEGNYEAAIRYVHEQLQNLEVNSPLSEGYPENVSQDLSAEHSIGSEGDNDRIARMRDYVLRVLSKP